MIATVESRSACTLAAVRKRWVLEDLPLPSPGAGPGCWSKVEAAGVNLFDTQLRGGPL